MLKFRFPSSARRPPNPSPDGPTQTQDSDRALADLPEHPSAAPSTSTSEPNLAAIHPASLSALSKQPPSSSALPSAHPSNAPPSTGPPSAASLASKKTRRKSYGGLRAMLGINQKPEDVPPPPVPIHSSEPPPQPSLQYTSHPSTDPSTSPANSFISIPPSPVTAESRPSTSSLRPFPFLGGIRRKSANSNAPKINPHNLPSAPIPSLPSSGSSLSPTTSLGQTTATKAPQPFLGHRIYSHGSSKKAQSVDDLSQFGLLPKPRLQPRRSVEDVFDSSRPHPTGVKSSAPAPSFPDSNPSDLHKGLDQIGELAGSLANMGASSKVEDRHPRLSNPKAMRTVYGIPIEDLFWRDGDAFPLLVDVLVELIEEKGLDQQGIYRVPGEKRVIENLQASIDERGVTGVDIWEDAHRDVHNLSGLLKLFLREIPGGVIPFDRYESFLAVSSLEESLRTNRLKGHVNELPKPNQILLVRLVRHFEKVVQHAEANSMLAHNVAIVFAPSLFRTGSEASNPLLSMQNIGKASAIVRHLVLNANEVFEQTEEKPAHRRKSAPPEKRKSVEKEKPNTKSKTANGRRHSKHGAAGGAMSRQSYQGKKKS